QVHRRCTEIAKHEGAKLTVLWQGDVGFGKSVQAFTQQSMSIELQGFVAHLNDNTFDGVMGKEVEIVFFLDRDPYESIRGAQPFPPGRKCKVTRRQHSSLFILKAIEYLVLYFGTLDYGD